MTGRAQLTGLHCMPGRPWHLPGVIVRALERRLLGECLTGVVLWRFSRERPACTAGPSHVALRLTALVAVER